MEVKKIPLEEWYLRISRQVVETEEKLNALFQYLGLEIIVTDEKITVSSKQ